MASARQERESDAGRNEYGLLMDMLHVSVSKHKLDEDFTLVWANAYYYEFIGYPREEYEQLFHNSPREYFASDPEDLATIAAYVSDALEHGRSGYECLARMQAKSGKFLWVKFAGTFIDEYVDGYQLSYTVMTDVTDLVEARQRLEKANVDLERLAFVDPVTEGFNQTRFDIVAHDAILAAPPSTYALVALDLKKFKLLNDIHGSESGDRVLRYVHDRLLHQLNPGEYAARITADAFNLLVFDEGAERMLERIEVIVQDVNSFNEGAARPYYLSFTVGAYPIDDASLPMTIVRDRANVARNSGKDSPTARHFTCALNSDVDRQNLLNEQDMENRMRAALGKGEFVAYLQPKQLLRDGSIGGAEALVRWMDPMRGLVPPDVFVPLFERNGFVIDVDLCVFDQVCAYLSSLMKQGRGTVPISVNMSRTHLRDADFLEPYECVRKRHGVPASLIKFELTETVVLEDPQRFVRVIDAMHEHGYRCSMDDFGSGYSSFNVLKDIDIDELKLDRVFFSNGESAEQRDWDVVSSIVDLAKKLELETVAEGVEAPGQADKLRAMGCDMLQGYVFSRPVPIEEFDRMLRGV